MVVTEGSICGCEALQPTVTHQRCYESQHDGWTVVKLKPAAEADGIYIGGLLNCQST